MLEGLRSVPPICHNRRLVVALVRFTAKSPGYPEIWLFGPTALENADSAGMSLIARATSRR